MTETPTLHMLCGKIAAGKSTLAASLAANDKTILVVQDKWMSALYPTEVKTLDDYVFYVARLQDAMRPHLVDLLRAGMSVVLDFPANTVKSRLWMRTVFEGAGAAHKLHFIDTPAEICRSRLHARNASGLHDYEVSDAEFDAFTRHFTPPSQAEGFDVIVHRSA
ncbi:MAG: ATP-binding protein [Parvularculaceae bacterium]|nr:ATP-binding protein [Parvularculaceae bacterium]